jgi:serine phosphatase RsbU (regulator of sigma subunit)
MIKLLFGPLVLLIINISFIIASSFQEIDSLKNLLPLLERDTNQVIVLNLLSEKLYKSQPDTALLYSEQALKLAEQLDYKRGVGKAYHNIGVVYYRNARYTESINYYVMAVKVLEEINDKNTLQKTYNNIGNVFFQQLNFDKAEEYYLASLRIKQENGDFLGMARSYNNLGSVSQNKKAYDKALDYYNSALTIMENLKDNEGKSQCLNNIGMIYIWKNEHKKALEILNEALAIKEELNDKIGIANTLNNIADIFYQMKEYGPAIEILNKSIALAKEMNAREVYKSAYEKLSQANSALGNYKSAYQYHTLYSQVKDSLLSEAQTKLTAEMEAKYENEKKEKENIELRSENDIRDMQIYALSGGFLLVIILSFVIYSGARQKQKANQLLSAQNEEITFQKTLIEQKNKDITDSIQYAKRIQEAIYPSRQLVKRHLENSFILFKPKDIISGDFYWMATIENKILFAAVDCTGHGVPGALMSIVGCNGLNQAVNEHKLTKPSEILNQLNKTVNHTLNKKKGEVTLQDGMDIALCCFDKEKMMLEYAGAYNPLYLVRDNQLSEIKADRHAVGAYIENEIKLFTNNEIEVKPGDMVYVFSDGYADQFGGENGKKFTYKKFKDALNAISRKSTEEQRHSLQSTFEQWKAMHDQVDDVCVIGVRL